MYKFNRYSEKLFNVIPGGIFGLLSVLVGVFCDLIAISLYPGYSILNDMVSTLGIGPGALIFNLGLIFSGFFAVLFYIYLGGKFKGEDSNDKLVKSAIIISIISSILMSLIGFFPAIQKVRIIAILHYMTALLSWVTGMIYCMIFGYLILTSSKFKNYLAFFGFTAACMILFLLILISLPFTKLLIPFIEWTMVFSVIVFVFIISIYTLINKV